MVCADRAQRRDPGWHRGRWPHDHHREHDARPPERSRSGRRPAARRGGAPRRPARRATRWTLPRL